MFAVPPSCHDLSNCLFYFSVMLPKLFLLYINDILVVTFNKAYFYTDGTLLPSSLTFRTHPSSTRNLDISLNLHCLHEQTSRKPSLTGTQ